MRVINSTARTTVLRELALLRALCASLRHSRRFPGMPRKLLGKTVTAAPQNKLRAAIYNVTPGAIGAAQHAKEAAPGSAQKS